MPRYVQAISSFVASLAEEHCGECGFIQYSLVRACLSAMIALFLWDIDEIIYARAPASPGHWRHAMMLLPGWRCLMTLEVVAGRSGGISI